MPRGKDPPIGLDTTVASDGAAHAATVDSASGSAVEALEAGTRIDRYEILALLGQGGMGSVYRARDTELARDVALKRIRPGRLDLDELRARLRREAQAMARVEHDAVVRVYDVGTAGDQLYVTMELVDGGTLDQWLATPRPWREVIAMYVRAGGGLVAAHDAGLIHRDFKPSNVLVDRRGRPRVTDFGLARSTEIAAPAAPDRALDAGLTVTGGIVGTPAYMAPEQLDGGEIGARADQFAFCVAVWEALHGKRPFEVRSPAQLVQLREAIAAGPPDPASSEVPGAVTAVLRRGLAEEPDRRWPSMHALLAALTDAARPSRGLRWGIAAGVVATAGVVAAIAWPRASSHASASVRLGAPSAIDRVPAGELSNHALLRDGLIARTSNRTVTLRSASGEVVLEIPSPDGREMSGIRPGAAASWFIAYTWTGWGDPDGPCSVWQFPTDGRAPSVLHELPACDAEVDLSPDERAVAIAGSDVRVRDRADGRVRWTVALEAGFPAWSPDGRHLLVSSGGESIVLDGASGEEVTRLRGWMRAWLDADRILHWGGVSGARHSELWVLRLSTGEDELLHVFDQNAGPISASPGALLIAGRDTQSRMYLAPASPATPTRLDELTRVETGAVEDFEPTAWTRDGQVISEALLASGRALIATRPGSSGRTLRVLDADNFGYATHTPDHLIYTPQWTARCEVRILALDDGHADRAWRTGACDQMPFVRCAAGGSTCVVVERNATIGHAFDPATSTIGVETRAVPYNALLSPDGEAWFVTDGATVTVHPLAGEPTTITPEPAIDGVIFAPITSGWGRTSATFLLVTRKQRHWELIELERSGQWRPLLTSDHEQLRLPLPSPDGKWIAIMGANDQLDYQYFPILADRGAR